MARPCLLISARKELFESFFSPRETRRLDRAFAWERIERGTISTEFRRQLSTADALITTWDSPRLDDGLPRLAPSLRIIAHCGGEVKSRFARSLFQRLTITNAAGPMARATAEMGAALLLYCTRNVDFYRAALRNLTLHVPSLESHGNRGFPLWPGACSAVRSFEDAERERVSMLMPLPPKR